MRRYGIHRHGCAEGPDCERVAVGLLPHEPALVRAAAGEGHGGHVDLLRQGNRDTGKHRPPETSRPGDSFDGARREGFPKNQVVTEGHGTEVKGSLPRLHASHLSGHPGRYARTQAISLHPSHPTCQSSGSGACGAAMGRGHAHAARGERVGESRDLALGARTSAAPGLSRRLCGRSWRPVIRGKAGGGIVLCRPRGSAVRVDRRVLARVPHNTAEELHVCTPRRRRSPPGVQVHRVRRLKRYWHTGLPTTPPAQALLDIADEVGFQQLRRAVSEAEYLKLVTLEEVDAVLGRGKPGSARLRAARECHRPQLARTKSRLEEKFLLLCERTRLPHRK